VRDLLANGRCSRAVLEFLLTTDVGGWVPGVEEDDAVSAVSELEVREWMEEQGAGAEDFFFLFNHTRIRPGSGR